MGILYEIYNLSTCDKCHGSIPEFNGCICQDCQKKLLVKISELEQKVKDLEAVVTNREGGKKV